MAQREYAKMQIDVLPESVIEKVIEFIKFQCFSLGVPEIEPNPFYSEVNLARIKRAIDDLDAGLGVEHELIEVDD